MQPIVSEASETARSRAVGPALSLRDKGQFWPCSAGVLLGLVGVLGLGAVLRLVWPGDIEYKGDESWTYERVREVKAGAPWPRLGMPSSQGAFNPGLSVWAFVALGQVVDLEGPADLARVVQWLNVLALFGLVLFAWRVAPAGEREIWLWATALVAVNPLAVLSHRKIWPPCLFPPLVLLFLFCWWHRQRRWPALGWGLLGALLGQIHIPGFFFAGGFVLWAGLFDRRGVAWKSWLLGSVLGILPLLAWLRYLATEAVFLPRDPGAWQHLFEGRFWLRWVKEPLGFGLEYSLGQDFGDFLRQPLWAGQPTWLVLGLHLLAALLGLLILLRALDSWRRQRDPEPRPASSPTAFTQNAALWGYGLLITLSSFPIHRHYMIVLFPLQFIWLARLALGERTRIALGRGLLAALVVVQGLLSIQFLGYIHDRQQINGDFGTTYAFQVQAGDAEECEMPEPEEP